MAPPHPEPDDPPTIGFFTPRLHPATPPTPAWPENLYWALVARWRREGRHLPSGADGGSGQDPMGGLSARPVQGAA